MSLSRKNGGGYRRAGERYAVPLDWSQPTMMGGFHDTIMKPALVAVGLPINAPETTATDTAPAVQRRAAYGLHDLRHTFVVTQLMSDAPYMQVSKLLGHSTLTITLNTYGLSRELHQTGENLLVA
ncbi:hypothetical protein AB0M12_38765 [Nocardia vinacea]|uniref:hypothetical protein n=1 Tax=Nocardia vinacea TaxID=96468 RepID=UPI003430BEF1